MSVSEEDRPSLTAEDSDDSGVHLKQTRSSDYDPDSDGKSYELYTSFAKDMLREGCLLWAKIRGFSYWPGVTTMDPFEAITNKTIEPSKKKKVHIHFLAYDNLRAWVHESDCLPYEGYDKYKELSTQFPKRKKDFEPGKKFKNIFERAVKEAEAVMCFHAPLRLEKLGFVYIPTDVEGSTRNVLTKKRKNRRNKTSQPKRCNFSSTQTHYKRNIRNESKDIYEFIDDNSDTDLLSDSEKPCDTTKECVPKLGSLIWGHMAGFPYWPCFVTRSSDGDYIRESKNKRSVHVQFFNWNDESGWVTKIIPWCSIAEFRRLAKEEIKSDGTCSADWSPVGKMLHKWKNAALEAESTSNLSRKERHNRFFVKLKNILTKKKIHGHENNTLASKSIVSKFQTPPPPLITSSTRLPPGWIIRRYKEEDYGEEARTEYQSPDGAVFLKIENAISYLFQQNNSGTRKRSYSCPGGCITTNDSSFSNLSPGPASKKRRLDAGWFILESDQLRYPSKPIRPQIDFLDLDNSVEYIHDASLPRGWSVKRVRRGQCPEVKSFYMSPECKTYSKVPQIWPHRREFASKVSAASYFEGMGHPAVELEHVIATGILQCLSRKEANHFLKMDEYLNYRLSESPNLWKTVAPTFVKLTPLPKEISQDSIVLIDEKDGKSILKCRLTLD